MSIEAALAENTAALKALHAVLTSGAALGAASPAPAATKNTKAPAPSPAATSPSPAPATTGPTENDALEKIKEVNKSTAAGCGRDGILALLTHFGLDPAKHKVPDLQKLGKHAEVIAAANNLLAGKSVSGEAPAAAEDDLGI